MSEDVPDEREFDEESIDRPTEMDAADVTAMAPSSTYKVLGEMATEDGTGILGHNTATSGTAHGVEGVTDSADAGAAGVYGEAAAGSGGNYGVEGTTLAPGSSLARAAGVKGNATNASSLASAAYGVLGRSDGKGYLQPTFGFPVYSSGVKGEATATSGTYTAGVYGTNNGAHTGAAGVKGEATQGSGTTYGVQGVTFSDDPAAAGVRGVGTTTAPAVSADGHVDVSKVGGEATISSSQTISSPGSLGLVSFDNAISDDFGGFAGHSAGYQVQVDGDYHVDASIDWDTSFSSSGYRNQRIDLVVNGSRQAFQFQPVSDDVGPTISVSKTLFDLSAGDVIAVEALFNDPSNSSMDLNSGVDATYMSLHRVG